MRRAFIVILFIAASASAQRHPARTLPTLMRVWYAEEKDDWNHAVAELVEYNGDPKVYAVPLGTPDGHWLFVWETTGFDSGSVPWRIEVFDTASAAAVRFDVLEPQSSIRKIFSEPTGKVLVIYKCKPAVPCGI